ncbi:phosphoribosylanthranilate isomerase [Falsiroseomonas selenitidurans]|uniref:N-(5'-phosphoribosyl)anthranilate isomerase n=1 Tax=Falsiroseomonas selenitidurans TaxID=2716335 RepID=A0ABX1EBM6_9PROT|nr:phosphoribosylanthranilate isomerase [Falsiroseomonas selenitidurans]NKC32320.1 phosphoribosylanthranilate isomerase [Falsiroseomonas selenitidurans]
MRVKICGLKDPAGLEAAARAGADYVGLVFFPPSPRAVTPAEAAALSAALPGGPQRVGLFVDADDALLEAVTGALALDVLQLHGAESPARCAAVRRRFGLPVMKALGIATPADLDALAAYAEAVDLFLLDAKAPPGAPLPGGNAAPFDWTLTAGRRLPRPWLLAGGLTPGNVAQAIAASGAPGVDVSSGVERARGVKDPALIAAFISAARAA